MPSSSELLSNDIWKLGCVFLELEAFLVRGGPAGVWQLRAQVTTKATIDGMTVEADYFDDSRFDDGERVKPEVIDWIKRLSVENNLASQLEPVLITMLAGHANRPTARDVTVAILAVSNILLCHW